ncbi:porin [Piscinibacter sakaiensis]|uniref:Porin n=1 Tax=Piscinibacter sakaiensis TaxID=1547922 RepID=A0A0K8P7K5_PISS1|nr:porin [Piscinibacter sakaiensis]GAP38612.1 porin [Piscinibacter sakaiensis]
MFRSSRVALAAAALLGVAASAQAQSSVQTYGLFDVSAGQFQNAGATKVRRLDSGNLSTSYLGFKGTEDLGGGLRANFALETFFLADTGGASRVPGVDVFWARNAWVGLSGDFGALKLGRAGPPLFVSTLIFNAFGDSFGYSPSIRQYYNAPYGTPLIGDSGWNNAITYSTPNVGGVSANLMMQLGEGAATAKGRNVGANVLYFGGPLALTGAWQQVKAQGVLGRGIAAFPGFQKQDAYQFGASYDFGVVKLFGQYGVIKTDAFTDVKVTNAHLSASVPIGNGAVLASYGHSKIDTAGVANDPVSKMLTVGYDHFLSKRTDVYAIYMNDKYTRLSTGNTFAVGIRHKF